MGVQTVQGRGAWEANSGAIYLSVVCFLISVVFVVFKLTRRSKSNAPPSPPKLPFIGNLHQLGTLPHRSLQTLAHKYGPLMLLQLGQVPTLLVSSAEVASEIFKTHDVFFSNRPKATAAGVFLYGYKDVGFSPYGHEWRQKRKVCVLELVSIKSVRSFQFIRVEEVAEMIGVIREACVSGRSYVDLSELLIALMNNIMSRCVLGQKYDTPDGSRSFGELGRKMLTQFAAFCVGDFFPSFGWVDVLTGQISKFKATLSSLDSFFDQIIAEHKAKMKKRDRDGNQSYKKDFVDMLLQLEEAGILNFELSQDILKALLVDMFIGASETTSTTLEWTMAELMKNPNTMEKAQEEVRRVVGCKANIDEDDVKQMNYLKCVVKETLRLHPPAPLLLPRETTSAVKLRGYDIPAKTRVMLNAWAIQRDPELWDRPDEFLPDRFENSQVDFRGQNLEFIPFGAGRRGCPGITFAVTVAEYALANLLYWFDWNLPKTHAPLQAIDMSERYGMAVSKKLPLLLEPIPFSSGMGSKPSSSCARIVS
ncbi:Cytochrome P450 71A1, partial [Mucuna pruriens]